VLGVHYARESNLYLQNAGVTTTYKEYPEAHTISSQMLTDMLQWLKK
jgi:predicted esterase